MAFHGEYREHHIASVRFTLAGVNYAERAVFNHTQGRLSTGRCIEDTDEYSIVLLCPNKKLSPGQVRYFEGFLQALKYAAPWLDEERAK